MAKRGALVGCSSEDPGLIHSTHTGSLQPPCNSSHWLSGPLFWPSWALSTQSAEIHLGRVKISKSKKKLGIVSFVTPALQMEFQIIFSTLLRNHIGAEPVNWEGTSPEGPSGLPVII